MKCLGLEHTVDRLGEPIQKPVKRVTFSSGCILHTLSKHVAFFHFDHILNQLKTCLQLHRYKGHKTFPDGDNGYWGIFKKHHSYFWGINRPDEGFKQILQDVEVRPPPDKPKNPLKQGAPVRNHTDKVYNVLLECQNDESKKIFFSTSDHLLASLPRLS